MLLSTKQEKGEAPFLWALYYINSFIINVLVVVVWQTTGVDLLMKCVNIPETNDSVVSPAIVSYLHSFYFISFHFIVKVLKLLWGDLKQFKKLMQIPVFVQLR